MFHNNNKVCILHHFRDIITYWLKTANYLYSTFTVCSSDCPTWTVIQYEHVTLTSTDELLFASCSRRIASEQCDCIMLWRWLDISMLNNTYTHRSIYTLTATDVTHAYLLVTLRLSATW